MVLDPLFTNADYQPKVRGQSLLLRRRHEVGMPTGPTLTPEPADLLRFPSTKVRGKHHAIRGEPRPSRSFARNLLLLAVFVLWYCCFSRTDGLSPRFRENDDALSPLERLGNPTATGQRVCWF